MPLIDGLFSGLDTTSIINQILAIEARPLAQLQKRLATSQEEKTALLDVSSRLLALQTRAKRLAAPSFFDTTAVASSSPGKLAGSGTSVSSTGAFSFTPRAMARAGLAISSGFAARTDKPGAGMLALGLGGGFVADPTSLDALNGGSGVARGEIKITDKSGASAVIDLTDVLNVEEVLARINGASGLDLSASVSGDSIVLADSSGGAGSLVVEEVGAGSTAADLGILGSTAGATLTGSDVFGLSATTSTGLLNDGLGVRRVAGDDLSFTLRDGTSFGVDLGEATTLGEVIDRINMDPDNPSTLVASIGADGNRILIEDTTGVAGTLTVASLGGGKSAEDLGIAGSTTGAAPVESVSGSAVIGGLNSVLLKVLGGGTGVDLSTLTIKDKSGTSELFDLSGAETVQDVLEILNSSGSVAIKATVNAAGNGILLSDTSGSTADKLEVSEGAGTTAADLGLLTPPGGVDGPSIDGGDLKRQYIGERTLLSSLNQGRGVSKGKLEIIDSAGVRSTISLKEADDDRIEDVLSEITGAAVSVKALINDDGTGIILEDTAGGSLKMRVLEVSGGTTARDLKLAGEADLPGAGKLDGAFTIHLDLDGTEDLDKIAEKINKLGLGLSASVISTGSGPTPYRLSIIGKETGSASRLLVDAAGVAGLSFTESTRARDSVLLYGDGASAIVVSDRDNEIDGLIGGLTLTIGGTSDEPVTITVSRDDSELVKQVASFVEKFNEAVKRIGELSDYQPATEKRPLLFADSTLRGVESRMYRELLRPVPGAGTFTVASQLGIEVQRNGTLVFDESEFRDALKKDPESVRSLFTAEETGLAVRFEKLLEETNHVTDGSITRATSTRDAIIEDMNKQIERFQERLVFKQETLRREFANLELIMSQTQGTLQRLSSQLGTLNRAGGGF